MRVSNEKVSEIFILINDENNYIFEIPGLDVPARIVLKRVLQCQLIMVRLIFNP